MFDWTRLDDVLGGGLPVDAINMLIGLPGTGKTILAQQYLFANATLERPALYLATVSEPFDKILRYGQSLRFFDPEAVGRSVFYEDLGPALNERGLAGVLEQVTALIKERRPGIIVIDSFKALSAYAEAAEFRRFLHEFAGHLSAFPASSFWIGEYGEEEIAVAPEFAVADAIISLSTTRASERETRSLRVLKLRGSEFAPGQHAYRLSANGIDVFPRLADQIDITSYPLDGARHSSGIAALDDMLADGYWPGASTLCAGPSGCGKTLMGLHFIFNGVRQGEPGVLATLQEHPTQLARILKGFGWSADEEGVELMYRSPVDMYIDEWVYDLLEAVERTGARRVLIDSLTDLKLASPDEIRFREYMYSLVQRLLTPGSERVHDLGATRPLPRPATLRVRRLAPLRQRRATPIHPRRSNRSARPHRPEDPREPTRTGNPRVQESLPKGSCSVTRSSPHRPSTSTNRAARERTSAHARADATDLLLLEELHAHLPVGLLVNDADTLEILHGNPPLPGFADHDLPLDQLIESHNDKYQPHLPADELAALVEEVAATGRPRHLPEFRHDSPGQEPNWWSATLHRIDTDRWGPVVVTLAVDLTDQVRARHLLGGARTTAPGPAADDRRRSRPQPRLLPPAGCRCPRPRPTGRRGHAPTARRRRQAPPRRR